MSSTALTGRVHSIQSLGTVDGPGVRFVAFLQGCPLRCGCCHNPDTWATEEGKRYTAEELVARAEKCRTYFGATGGITLSGGEPLLQADFVHAVFALCHARGIHTCLDTSGCILDDTVERLLAECDRVLLDIKYTSDAAYRAYVGCSISAPLVFLDYLDAHGIPTTLRQVIIPTLNDTEENIHALADIAAAHSCVDKVELLPFRKICEVKYRSMGKVFRFADYPEPTHEQMQKLEQLLHI